MIASLVLATHMVLAVALITLVLLQHGKGADAGAAFGSGASATVFGAQGAGNFLSRTTGIVAAAFFATSLALGYLYTQREGVGSVMDRLTPAAEEAPAPADELPVPAETPPLEPLPPE